MLKQSKNRSKNNSVLRKSNATNKESPMNGSSSRILSHDYFLKEEAQETLNSDHMVDMKK